MKCVRYLQIFWLVAGVVLSAGAVPVWSGETEAVRGVIKAEFIFEDAPFRSCHASTIAETRDGLVAAWFGGSREGALDVSIWMSRFDGKEWSAPAEVVNGADDEKHIRYPCWNPVLHQTKAGPLLLFYKVGPRPDAWWGMLTRSENNGRTWSIPKRLPDNILGPIKNKPLEMPDGLLICGSSTEDAGWRVHIERTRSLGREWTRTEPLNRAMEFGAIQPTLLYYPNGRLQMLCRTKQGVIAESWSTNRTETWSRIKGTDLPNPNSGIDAVVLRDGRAMLVYNHSTEDRGVLNVAMSTDGRRWSQALVLENEPGSEFSYPAVIQTSDGLVHVTYTWKRKRIRHVVLDPFKL